MVAFVLCWIGHVPRSCKAYWIPTPLPCSHLIFPTCHCVPSHTSQALLTFQLKASTLYKASCYRYVCKTYFIHNLLQGHWADWGLCVTWALEQCNGSATVNAHFVTAAHFQLLHDLIALPHSLCHCTTHHCCCPQSVRYLTLCQHPDCPFCRFTCLACIHDCEVLANMGQHFFSLR